MTEAEQNAYRRDRVGFIFQSFNLISNLTAVENVLVPFLPARHHAEHAAAGGRAAAETSAWATGSTIGLTRSPAASSSGWRSRGP